MWTTKWNSQFWTKTRQKLAKWLPETCQTLHLQKPSEYAINCTSSRSSSSMTTSTTYDFCWIALLFRVFPEAAEIFSKLCALLLPDQQHQNNEDSRSSGSSSSRSSPQQSKKMILSRLLGIKHRCVVNIDWRKLTVLLLLLPAFVAVDLFQDLWKSQHSSESTTLWIRPASLVCPDTQCFYQLSYMPELAT